MCCGGSAAVARRSDTVVVSQAQPAGMEVSRSRRSGVSLLPAICEMGLLAEAVLRRTKTGRVVAVFDSSFYAAFGREWICIGLSHIGSGPLNVVCESRPHGWPEIGSPVAVAGSVFYLNNMPFASLDRASVWRPKPVPSWTVASLQRGLEAATEVWRKGELGEGLAAAGCVTLPVHSTLLVSAAAPGIAALARMIAGALDESRVSSEDQADIVTLIGLGPGLTPSGDDLLGGALIALASLGLLKAQDELWRACSRYLDRSNDISRLHLQAAAQGYGAAALHGAINATTSGDVDRIPHALAAVSAIGHCSGRDSFAGALIVLRAVERHFVRDRTGVR